MVTSNPTDWGQRLEDPRIKASITGEDFDDAEAIKEYYSKKIMWNSLRDSKISDYRRTLVQLLQHPKTMLTKREVGMFVTLPYFYEEDQTLDTIAKQYRVTDCPAVKPNLERVQRRLVYIHSTRKWLNRCKNIYYWFADDNQFVYCIQIEEKNVLRNFFEHCILTESSTLFDTHITKVEYPFDYYKMFDYKILKENNA
jgi:predicted DNA-binding protein YlxM (UPF0122 family)